MALTTVFGLQWGDEGKGKIVDYLSDGSDLVVRYQGGANAGHTVVTGGKEFILHLVPSGILRPEAHCLIASGVVVDPGQVLSEIEELEAKGIAVGRRLHLAGRAHAVLPYHKLLDGLAEASRGDGKIGTTRRGIGPCYADKAARIGLRLADLAEPAELAARLRPALEEKNRLLTKVYETEPLAYDALYAELREYGQRLAPYLCDASAMLADWLGQGKQVLFEGSQGVMLDLDHGTYPFVTSSSTGSGGAPAGAGVPPTALGRIVGVVKAYTTRVGAGPLPTELEDETGERLRAKGAEFGATTGRPRRCGWFDAVAARYAARIAGPSELALTKIDVLDGMKELRLAVAYRHRGRRLESFPPAATVLAECEPEYQTVPGWEEDTSKLTDFADFPPAARRYVELLESLVGVPISLVSVGRDRSQLLQRADGRG